MADLMGVSSAGSPPSKTRRDTLSRQVKSCLRTLINPRSFPLSVAGIDRYPRKITKAMDKKKVEKRSLIKPFVKHVNLTHLMPTRYQCDFDLKKVRQRSDDPPPLLPNH